jgi:DNA-binding transcriptional ArsR family regulator
MHAHNPAMPQPDTRLADVAAAIAEPARARMLCTLLDGRARTATELALAAEVAPSTASTHIARLETSGLVTVLRQGKHRYAQLASPAIAQALESLLVLAGPPRTVDFSPNTPVALRHARSCYDHAAGELGVALHDQLFSLRWLRRQRDEGDYEITSAGATGFTELGVDMPSLQHTRRRLACACLDWSERRAHLGGALGAALLALLLERRWLQREFDSRALRLTPAGKRLLRERLQLDLQEPR